MLRLRVRLERANGGKSVETVGIANSGFVGLEPEVVAPVSVVEELRLHEVIEPTVHVKATADGREATFTRYRRAVRAYVVAEDRVEGPVVASVLTSPGVRHLLLNDKLLGAMRVVLLDFAEGTWCFRDELGRRERRSY